MNLKAFLYAVLIFLSSATNIYSMNTVENPALISPQEPSLLHQFPQELIEYISSFLDGKSLTAFRQSCRHCYACLHFIFNPSNPFKALPPQALTNIAHYCTQGELIKMWHTCRFCSTHFIDPEKPFCISCENYFPYHPRKTPTHALIMHISEITAAATRRKAPIKLDLSNQSLRPGIDRKTFLPRLIECLERLQTSVLIKELNLSHNFILDFPLYPTHYSPNLKPATPQNVTDTLNTVFEHCTNLVSLSLDKNNLTIVPSSLSHLHKLKQLSLAWNQLSPDHLADYTVLSHLTELNISHNNLTRLPSSLYAIPTLKLLDISDNPLNEKTKKELQNRARKELVIRLN